MTRGDPVWAVLIPPRLIRFRELVQIGDEQLDVDFTGWNSLYSYPRNVRFLFLERRPMSSGLSASLATYERWNYRTPGCAPTFGGMARRDHLSYPFAAVSRLPVTHPTEASDLFDQLGNSIAQWHELAPPEIAGSRPPATTIAPTIAGSVVPLTLPPLGGPLPRQPIASRASTESSDGASRCKWLLNSPCPRARRLT